jgi:hypothetical protein
MNVLQIGVMSGNDSFSAIVRALGEDPEYRRTFTERLKARDVDQPTVERLVAYARDRQATRGQAIARKVLTDAGVSWESL